MPGTIHYFLTWMLFLGIYIANSVPREGSLKVPAAVGGMAAIILLLMNFRKMRLSHLIWILSIVTLCLISLTLRAYTWPELSIQRHVTQHIASLVVLVYAIVISYAAYLELMQWDRDRIARMFKILTLVLLVGAALEVFVPPFKALSDSFRHIVFAHGVYENDTRDLLLYGAVRPKLFTSEPSHLAKYFVLFTVAWFLITTKKQKYLWFFAYVIIGTFLIRSPIVLIAPIIGLASLLARKEMNNHQKIVLLIVLFALLTPMALLSAETLLIPRLERISAGTDTSFIVRFLAPLQVMASVLRDHPILGLGFGAKELGLDYTNEALTLLSNADYDVEYKGLGHNFLFTSVIQFGLVGFPIFVLLLWRMLKIFAREELFLVTITMFGFMQAMGNPNSFRIWFFLFVLCAVVNVRSRSSYVEGPAHGSSNHPSAKPTVPYGQPCPGLTAPGT